MKINANEIDTIEEAGEMNAAPVKMIRTKGGLWIAVGRPKGRAHDEALAAGSHPAIVKYNIEKKYADYRPSLQKSEGMPQPKVMQHSHFLPEDLRKSGYDVHSLETLQGVEFVVSQHGVTRALVKCELEEGNLEITSTWGGTAPFSKALIGAIAEKSLTENYAAIKNGLK